MAELDKIEHPKPLRDFIYESFNTFSTYHPWVGGENIKPKSVAREMFERCFSFNDYIQYLGAARSEGVLLRYLSQAYKTIHQTIPESYWTDELDEIKGLPAHGHSANRREPAREWERMMEGEPLALTPIVKPAELELPQTEELVKNPKKLAARVRNELYMFERALSDGRYEEALELIRPTDERSLPRMT